MANITTATTPSIRHQNAPDIDENEAGPWTEIMNLRNILFDIDFACGIPLGLIGLLLFLTSLNPKLRAHSPLWYFYHLNAMSTVCSLLVSVIGASGMALRDRSICFFYVYTMNYIYYFLGINIFFLNVEIYFTKILPLQKWQWNPFIRFIIAMLATWNFVSVLIIYVVVNNNQAHKYRFNCFRYGKELWEVNNILSTVVPGAILLICTIVMIGTRCLKKSRIRITSASGGLREIQTVTQDGETQWICLAVFTNVVFVIRTVAFLIIMYGGSMLDYSNIQHHVIYWVLKLLYFESIYLLPFGLFFIADGRAVVKALVCKGIGLTFCGKVKFGEDLEQFVVSYRQESEACVH